MSKRVIVTGATGFIGSHLCHALLKQGAEVYGVGRKEDNWNQFYEYEKFHMIALDFEHYYEMKDIIADRDFDYFIHTALSGVNGKDKKDYRIQLNNTVVACDAVKIAKELQCKRFVMLGSVDEFESCFSPDSEFAMPNHARVYGLAKFAAENIGKTVALDLEMEYVSALLSLTYGEGNKTNILPNMIIRNASKGLPMNLITGDNYFDMIYIDDAVEGILTVADKGRNMESYFIGHSELKTFRAYVEEICAALQTDIELKFGTYQDSSSVVRFEDIRRDKLFDDTGFVCRTSIDEGILATQKWLLSQEI